MIKIEDFDALQIFSNTATRLSQGEILQIEKVKKTERLAASGESKKSKNKTLHFSQAWGSNCDIKCKRK